MNTERDSRKCRYANLGAHVAYLEHPSRSVTSLSKKQGGAPLADEDAPALLATMESGRVFVLKSADANPPVIAECPRCADEITEIVQSVKADAFH